MIPLAVDARMWAHPGIGRYIRELVKAQLSLPKGAPLHLLGPDSIQDDLKAYKGRFTFQKADAKIYSLSEQLVMPALVNKAKVLHTPHFNVPVFSKSKWVVTVHDLIYLKQPGPAALYVRYLLKQIEKRADAVLAVSEHTKNDLLTLCPKLKGRVFVTHEAASDFFYTPTTPEMMKYKKDKYDLHLPIILYVGSLKPHKNLVALLEAFIAIRQEVPHQLILAGKKDPKYKAFWDLINQGQERVRVMEGFGDDSIRALYETCSVFVLPSLIEGFGLPVLEAMAAKAPVIASNCTSLPEVGGDVAQYFDPTDKNALTATLRRVLMDETLRKTMSERGPEQARKFTWAKTAALTDAVYQKVLSL